MNSVIASVSNYCFVSESGKGVDMKRKELMKRTLALTLSAAMTIGNMPVMAYAGEVVETEEGGGASDSRGNNI